MASEALLDPVGIAIWFSHILERLGISYVICGSFASSVHGDPRSTNDIDIVADVKPEHIEPLLNELVTEAYVSRGVVEAAVRSGGSFNVIRVREAVKIDVFVAGNDPFEVERLRLRQRALLASDPPAELFVDTAEHTILRKLEWYRRGGETSERQWLDVLGILRLQGASLDQARLEAWAARLGVSDLLSRAAAEASRS